MFVFVLVVFYVGFLNVFIVCILVCICFLYGLLHVVYRCLHVFYGFYKSYVGFKYFVLGFYRWHLWFYLSFCMYCIDLHVLYTGVDRLSIVSL